LLIQNFRIVYQQLKFLSERYPSIPKLVCNLKRDPFEGSLMNENTLAGMTGVLAAPSTAYIYDWNILPIGQLMWMKELMSYKEFPALQTPSSYNLDQIITEMSESKTGSHAGE
jgi:arylsulfatase